MAEKDSQNRPNIGTRDRIAAEEEEPESVEVTRSAEHSTSHPTPRQVAYNPAPGRVPPITPLTQISPSYRFPAPQNAGSPIIYPDAQSIPLSLRDTRIHPSPLRPSPMPRNLSAHRFPVAPPASYESLPGMAQPTRRGIPPFVLPPNHTPQAGIYGGEHQSSPARQLLRSSFIDPFPNPGPPLGNPAEMPIFDTSITRSNDSQRPTPQSVRKLPSDSSAAGFTLNQGTKGTFGPPPFQAYLASRGHRREGNSASGQPSSRPMTHPFLWPSPHPEVPSPSMPRFNLEIVQQPERGLALGRAPLRQATQSISPPVILRLVLKNIDGTEVPSDLLASLRGTVVVASLVSAEGQDRARMRFREEVGSEIPSRAHFPASSRAIPNGETVSTLLGTLSATPMTLYPRPGSGRHHYFVFEHLVVRPVGRFRLCFKLVNVTRPNGNTLHEISLVHDLVWSQSFDVTESWDGPVPASELTSNFADQQVRGLRKGSRLGGDESDPQSE